MASRRQSSQTTLLFSSVLTGNSSWFSTSMNLQTLLTLQFLCQESI